MTEISRVALFGKLNKVGYQAVEGATVFCKMRGNPYVELVHWLAQILQGQDNDILRIIKHYDLDPSRIAADMQKALDKLPRGATSISDLSAHLEEAMERAWVFGSLLYSSNQVRTGHLILGLLKTPGLRGVLLNISGEFGKIKADDLAEDFHLYHTLAALAAEHPEAPGAPPARQVLAELSQGVALNQRQPPPGYDPRQLKRRVVAACEALGME